MPEANSISGEIDAAEKLRTDAEAVLAEYRERLVEARAQADEIVSRARAAGDAHQKDATEQARAERDRLLEQTRRDIEAETRRAIDEIRSEGCGPDRARHREGHPQDADRR